MNEASDANGIEVRRAGPDDGEAVVGLTRAGRAKLAAWSPVYFRPRDGADEGHEAFLRFVLASDDHRTTAITDRGSVIGFFQEVAQPSHLWVDDLSLADGYRWADVAEVVDRWVNERPWITCVSAFDDDRANGLAGIGMTVASSYWTRPLTAEDVSGHLSDGIGETDRDWPRHTFGGMPFDPGLPGALAVGDADGNFATGSPSVEPPIYDPGGPTTVVDRVGGEDRRAAVDLAIGASADRFDAQLVVVVAAEDTELVSILVERGFARQVDVFIRST